MRVIQTNTSTKIISPYTVEGSFSYLISKWSAKSFKFGRLVPREKFTWEEDVFTGTIWIHGRRSCWSTAVSLQHFPEGGRDKILPEQLTLHTACAYAVQVHLTVVGIRHFVYYLLSGYGIHWCTNVCVIMGLRNSLALTEQPIVSGC